MTETDARDTFNDQQKLKTSFQEAVGNIADLKDLRELPSSVAVNGGGSVYPIIGNNAKWHTNCRRRINKQKIERGRVIHRAIPSPVKIRRMCLGTACITQKHSEGLNAKNCSAPIIVFFLQEATR